MREMPAEAGGGTAHATRSKGARAAAKKAQSRFVATINFEGTRARLRVA